MVLGEGGERAMVRRLAAICAHKRLDLGELAARRRLRLCFRVPKLTSGEELQVAAGELAEHPAALVVLDPLYLAVAGAASGADLYAMVVRFARLIHRPVRVLGGPAVRAACGNLKPPGWDLQ